jgi:hypothetical protein
MEPSEYFMRLSPHERIDELKSQIAKLNEELRWHQQVLMDEDGDIPTSVEKIRQLILEMELCQQCIPWFQQPHHFSARASGKVNRLRSAA